MVHLYKLVTGKHLWLKQPFTVQFDTQNICNLACIYCNPQGTFAHGKHSVLPLKTIEYVLKYIRDKGWFISYVPLFMDGDPLLEKRLPEIAAMVKRYLHTKTLIFTNATPYFNRSFLTDKNIDEIHFTISAATAETYAKVHGRSLFGEALKTVHWFSQRKRWNQEVVMVYVLCKENKHELEMWKELFAEYKHEIRPVVTAGEIRPQSLQSKTSVDVETIFPVDRRYLGGRPCPTWASLNIGCHGEIMHCCDMPYEFNWGYVGEADIEEAWHKRNKLGLDHPCCKKCMLRDPDWKRMFHN